MLRLLPIFLLLSSLASAEIKYQQPDKMISDLVDSSGFSYPLFNPQFSEFVKYRMKLTPSIEYMDRPLLKLAGARFNPKNLAPASGAYRTDLRYYDQKQKKDLPISFGKNSYIRKMNWNPAGKVLAVQVEAEKCVELWFVNIPSLQKKKASDVCLNTALTSEGSFEWLDDTQVIVLRRAKTEEIRVSRATPVGPVVKDGGGKVSQNRTYPDLLKTPQDADAFERALQSKITIVNTTTLAKKDLGPVGAYSVIDPSPNKKWMIVAKMQRPYSYAVPYFYFKRERMLWSMDGKVKKTIGEVGPFENIPIQGVPTGPRDLQWVLSTGQSYLYTEAQDDGDWKKKVPFRDFLYLTEIKNAKGDLATSKIAQFENRFTGVTFLEDAKEGFLVADYNRDSEVVRMFRLLPQAQGYDLKEFLSRNANDDYSDPGTVIMGRNEFHQSVGRIQKTPEGNFIYWMDKGATPEGERPVIRKMNLADMKATEVFRSSLEKYEDIWGLFPKEFSRFLVRVESPTQAPQFEVRRLDQPQAKGPELFTEDNPFRVMAQLKRTLLKYKRKDGIQQTGVLYYPLDYQEGKKYPVVISAYPLEYTDAKSAGQTRGAANKFEIPYRASEKYFALKGYFVLDEAQMPIVGPPETKNDTFIEQLTSDAEATVKALSDTGLIDTKKIGVVGHSYGAFMVAHLLTQTKLFAAGIARSGAYNRTLTPFGFQGERRPLWDAKTVYMKLSPFMDVEKMKTPLLLIHGMEDNNPGTFTLQSERYFEALKGQGATTRLVLLPAESHGYSAQESVNHVLWESFQWFDKYLKGSGL